MSYALWLLESDVQHGTRKKEREGKEEAVAVLRSDTRKSADTYKSSTVLLGEPTPCSSRQGLCGIE